MGTYDLVPAAYDRMSTILGMPCRIMQPVGVPKAREDCQPFTFELHATDGTGPRVPSGGFARSYQQEQNVKCQEKFIKGLEKLTKAQARKDAARAKAEAKARKIAA